MFKFLPYILKNLRGHRVRTLMTIGGTALLMFLFLFVSSLQEGLGKLLNGRDERRIVFQAYRFCPSTSNLPLFFEDTIREDPRVKEVLPVKVLVNNCRASLDTVVFHGVPAETLTKLRQFHFLHGDWNAFLSRSDGALVGRRLAERRELVVGRPFTVAGVTVVVQGIFSSDDPGEENLVYTHLRALQFGKSEENQDLTVTLFEVYPKPGVDAAQADALAAAIDEKIRTKYQPATETKPLKAFYQRALADLVDLIRFTRWLGFICVGVVVVLVANSVIMAVQDRVQEHAVLQTLGFSGRRVFALMLTESMIISLAGGVLGVFTCFLWLRFQAVTVSTEGVSIDFLASPALVAWGLGLSGVVGILAGIVPAWQAGRAEIVTSLR